MLLPLLTLSLHSKQPLLLPRSLSSTSNTIRARHQLGFLHGRGCQALVARGVDNGSPRSEFEMDPEKAREGLVELDQQLQALSEKQLRQPKIRVTDLNLTRNGSVEEEEEEEEGRDEVTADLGSPLGILIAGLFFFTVFYNILFNTVIKPSIDLPEPASYLDYKSIDEVSAIAARGSSGSAVLQLLPVVPQIFNL